MNHYICIVSEPQAVSSVPVTYHHVEIVLAQHNVHDSGVMAVVKYTMFMTVV